MAAAVTGHLVLSTIHTVDAPSRHAAAQHLGVPPYLVSGRVGRRSRSAWAACARLRWAQRERLRALR
jgi:hypothetical protein